MVHKHYTIYSKLQNNSKEIYCNVIYMKMLSFLQIKIKFVTEIEKC